MNKMRKLYKEKHDILLEELKPLLKKYRLSGEYAGLHVLLTSRSMWRRKHFYGGRRRKESGCTGCMKRRWASLEQEEATLLIGYAGLRKKEIREGLAGLGNLSSRNQETQLTELLWEPRSQPLERRTEIYGNRRTGKDKSFYCGRTKGRVAFRIAALQKLENSIVKYEKEINEALYADLA